MRKYNISVKAALAVFALALSACSSDNDIVDNEPNNQERPATVTNQTMTFSAIMDSDKASDAKATRTTFTDNGDRTNNTVWAEDDAISILNTASVDEERPEEGVFTIGEPADGSTYSKQEKFSGTKIKANGNNNDQFYAFYPADADNFTNTNGTVKMTATIPTVQTAIDGSYDQSLHFMSAYSTNSTFKFKNVCALLKIKLTSNTTVNRIKVVANPTLESMDARDFGYTSIAGEFDATISSTDGTSDVEANEEEKTFVELRKGNNEVIGNGTFYLVVLPVDIENGFTIIFEKTNGNTYQRINSNVKKFVCNTMYNLGTYDCSGAPTNTTGYEFAVDLDLPSGTLWSKRNMSDANDGTFVNDANYAEYGDGGHFSFGKTSVERSSSYALPTLADNNTLKGSDDIAYYSKNNKRWCMPIYAQLYELYNKIYARNSYKRTWFGSNQYDFAQFISERGITTSFPYAGYQTRGVLSTSTTDDGSRAYYWSRTYDSSTGKAYCLVLEQSSDGNDAIIYNNDWKADPYLGYSVLPVATNNQIAPIK